MAWKIEENGIETPRGKYTPAKGATLAEAIVGALNFAGMTEANLVLDGHVVADKSEMVEPQDSARLVRPSDKAGS